MIARALLYALGVVWLMSLNHQAVASTASPAAFVEETFAALADGIKAGDIHAGMSDAEILRYFERELGPRIDFERFARGVMGKYARLASKPQLSAFAENLKTQMLKTYSKGLEHVDRFDRVEVTNTTLNQSKNSARVATRLRLIGGESYQVTYQLRLDQLGSRITNLIAESINLGLVYRNQFADLFNAQGRNMAATLEEWTRNQRQPQQNDSDDQNVN